MSFVGQNIAADTRRQIQLAVYCI